MNIRAALDRLIVIQAALSITSPVSLTVKRAYKYHPPASVALPDRPAWMNAWTFIGEDRHNSLRIQRYAVNMQLLAYDADEAQAADIASAFHVALIDALDADVTLAGTVTQQTIRGADPTLVVIERAGRPYIGLNLFLDLEMKEATNFS